MSWPSRYTDLECEAQKPVSIVCPLSHGRRVKFKPKYFTYQTCSVTQLCLTLFDPMDYSTPGFLVLPYLPEFAQTHVHWVGNAIWPSHHLSPPSPPVLNLSQHLGLFQWVSSLHQVAKVLEFQLQHQSFQRIFRTDFLEDGLVGSPCSPGNSQESSPRHSSKASILMPSAFFKSNYHIHTWPLDKP